MAHSPVPVSYTHLDVYKRQAHDRGKGIIVVVNKWDAIEKTDKTIYEYTNKLKETLAYICLLYTSRCV